ncbi:VWA domain-containing protein [Patescibacteria group bacterium]|nr:VWA domain-containing protein [Patescibacteria group bacterium]
MEQSEEKRKNKIGLVVALLILGILILAPKCFEMCDSVGMKKGTLHYVQLLYNEKVPVKCTVFDSCDFTMFYGEHFVVQGVKLKEYEELIEDRVELMGGGLALSGDSPIIEDIIRKATSEKFVFKTSFGDVPAIIKTSVSIYKKRKDYQRVKGALCAISGNSVHGVIDASGSMDMYKHFLLPITMQILDECDKTFTGITWYGNKGQVQDSVADPKTLFDEISKGGPPLGSWEAPSWALNHAANKFKPDVLFLLTDEGSSDGTRPHTHGIPVFGVAIGPDDDCVQDVRAITRHTGGAMMRIQANAFGLPQWLKF